MRGKIKELLKRVLGLEEVLEDISQKNCEKWDSLHHLNVIIELETEFNVSFEPEDIAEMRSLQEIENKLKDMLVN
jgi:acyl carrier protein